MISGPRELQLSDKFWTWQMRVVGGAPELFCTQAIWDHETLVVLDFEVTSDKRQAKVSDVGSRNLGSRATSDERRTTSAERRRSAEAAVAHKSTEPLWFKGVWNFSIVENEERSSLAWTRHCRRPRKLLKKLFAKPLQNQ